MGFGREATRVREESLSSGQRARALTSCIELAQPIGFHATWAYLEERTGLDRRDPEMFAPSIDLLETERAQHLQLEGLYAVLRRTQKAAGLRVPPRCHASPRSPRRWHGDERNGARHALDLGRRASHSTAAHPFDRLAQDAAGRAVTGGDVQDAEALERALDWSRRQLHVVGWWSDHELYLVAMDVNRLLGHVYLLTMPVPVVGEPWHFVPPAP